MQLAWIDQWVFNSASLAVADSPLRGRLLARVLPARSHAVAQSIPRRLSVIPLSSCSSPTSLRMLWGWCLWREKNRCGSCGFANSFLRAEGELEGVAGDVSDNDSSTGNENEELLRSPPRRASRKKHCGEKPRACFRLYGLVRRSSHTFSASARFQKVKSGFPRRLWIPRVLLTR